MIVEFTERKKAEISEQEANRVSIAQILKICKIPTQSFIRDGKLIEWEDGYTSHSYTDYKEVREVTELDIWAFEIIRRLKTDG